MKSSLSLFLLFLFYFLAASIGACGNGYLPERLFAENQQGLVGGQQGSLVQTVWFYIDFVNDPGGYGCTGSLLSRKSVLTAAHCVTNNNGNPVKGGFVVAPYVDGVPHVSLDPNKVYKHPTYPNQGPPPSEAYDVAVFTLMPTETSNGSIQLDALEPAPYVSISSSRGENTAYWVNGHMCDAVAQDTVNCHAMDTIVGPDSSDSRYPYQYTDQFTQGGPRVIDSGDSGGPLFLEAADDPNDGMGGWHKPTVYGVVSRGASFARIDPVRSWILEKMEICDCQSGPCCDGCNYRTSDFVCNTQVSVKYYCLGTSCGDDVYRQREEQHCAGQSALCDGLKIWAMGEVSDNCTAQEKCIDGNSSCQSDPGCGGACNCSSGPCCDGCHYYSSSRVCEQDVSTEYTCRDGTGCGSDVFVHHQDRVCSGDQATCSGAMVWDAEVVYIGCSSTEKCSTSNHSCEADPSCGTSDDNADFVMDVSIPDGTVISAGTPFVKTWRMRNSGSSTWRPENGYELAYQSGELFGADAATPLKPGAVVDPGREVDIDVDMLAPSSPGSYRGYWRMNHAGAGNFGERVWVEIVVQASAAEEVHGDEDGGAKGDNGESAPPIDQASPGEDNSRGDDGGQEDAKTDLSYQEEEIVILGGCGCSNQDKPGASSQWVVLLWLLSAIGTSRRILLNR